MLIGLVAVQIADSASGLFAGVAFDGFDFTVRGFSVVMVCLAAVVTVRTQDLCQALWPCCMPVPQLFSVTGQPHICLIVSWPMHSANIAGMHHGKPWSTCSSLVNPSRNMYHDSMQHAAEMQDMHESRTHADLSMAACQSSGLSSSELMKGNGFAGRMVSVCVACLAKACANTGRRNIRACCNI